MAHAIPVRISLRSRKYRPKQNVRNGNNLISVRQSIPADFPTQGRVIGSRTNPYITPHQVTSNLLPAQKTEFAPKILLTNVMSLVPKIDELRILTSEQSFDLVFVTETWLRESVCDTHVTLSDYHLSRRDRILGTHGGDCMYSI